MPRLPGHTAHADNPTERIWALARHGAKLIAAYQRQNALLQQVLKHLEDGKKITPSALRNAIAKAGAHPHSIKIIEIEAKALDMNCHLNDELMIALDSPGRAQKRLIPLRVEDMLKPTDQAIAFDKLKRELELAAAKERN